MAIYKKDFYGEVLEQSKLSVITPQYLVDNFGCKSLSAAANVIQRINRALSGLAPFSERNREKTYNLIRKVATERDIEVRNDYMCYDVTGKKRTPKPEECVLFNGKGGDVDKKYSRDLMDLGYADRHYVREHVEIPCEEETAKRMFISMPMDKVQVENCAGYRAINIYNNGEKVAKIRCSEYCVVQIKINKNEVMWYE